MPLDLAPLDRPEPVRLDMLSPGDGFTLWWDRSNGMSEEDIEGTVRYVAGTGYVAVRIRRTQGRLVEFVDKKNKAHSIMDYGVQDTEWACGTFVVPKENDMARVNKTAAAPVPAPAKTQTEKVAKEKKEKVPAGECLCGCGAEVNREFRPGHDARFYSQLAKLVDGKLKFGELSDRAKAKVKNVAGAKALLDAHKRPPTAANAPKAKAAAAKA